MARDDRQQPPDMPRSRRIPGDIGWRPDPGDVGNAGVPEPGLALRVLSVIPFLVAGVTGVVALVGWALIFIVGVGDQESIWEWAQGRPTGEVFTQSALVLLVGLACAAVTGLAMWAALQAFREETGSLFWTGTQVVFGALALVMVVVDQRYPDAFADLGIGAAEWWLLFAIVALGMIVAHVRMRRERAARRAREARSAALPARGDGGADDRHGGGAAVGDDDTG